MITLIRIHGKIKIAKVVEATLDRLRIRRKYACIIMKEDAEKLGMLKKVRDFVAYGKISKETFIELIKKRGQLIDRTKKEKIDAEKIAIEILEKNKRLQDFNLKPFFRLHPPRGGIKSRFHYPKGVLGDHGDKINDLIKRML